MTPYLSKVISTSRIPIICGVVMIHSQIYDTTPVSYFCGEIFGRIGVPLFYLISGYLFFQHYENNLKCYKGKIGKRIKSLLIPYLLWNLIAYLFYAFVTNDMQPSQFIESFWVVTGKGGHSPADGPLWFVRTLMMLSVASPAIYILNKYKYLSWLSPVVLIMWLFDAPLFDRGIVIGFSLFNFGAWMAISEIDKKIKEPTRWFSIGCVVAYMVFALIELHFYPIRHIWYHNLVVITGMLMFYALPCFKVSKALEKFGGASFFMYCIHEMIIRSIQLADIQLVNRGGYLSVVSLTILISLIVYYALKKFAPQILSVLSGNR